MLFEFESFLNVILEISRRFWRCAGGKNLMWWGREGRSMHSFTATASLVAVPDSCTAIPCTIHNLKLGKIWTPGRMCTRIVSFKRWPPPFSLTSLKALKFWTSSPGFANVTAENIWCNDSVNKTMSFTSGIFSLHVLLQRGMSENKNNIFFYCCLVRKFNIPCFQYVRTAPCFFSSTHKHCKAL